MMLKKREKPEQRKGFVLVMLVRKSLHRLSTNYLSWWKGQRCATLRCPVRFHNHCAETFFSPRNTVCPACKTPWKDHLPVGEAACSDRSRRRVSNRQRDTRSESRESRRSTTQTSPRSSRSRSPTLRRSSAGSPAGRRTSRQGSRRTSVAQSIQEDEEDEDIYG